MKIYNLYLMGEVNSDNVNSLIKDIHNLELKYLDSKKEEIPTIKLFLKTNGGDVAQGLSLHDVIKKSFLDIEIICIGTVFSIGIVILLSCEKRYSYPNTHMLIHNVCTNDFSGTRVEQSIDYKYTKFLQQKINNIILQNTNISKTLLNKKLNSNLDWYLDLKDCQKYNLIKEII